jgi:hypothetical protein
MEVLRYRCEERDWQRQLRYARERWWWWSWRTRWYPDASTAETPPEVLFTSTGVLIDGDMARPWRGAGYELLDAHVSDDISPWIELKFRNRLGREVFQLPVPEGRLKAAMELTEMLRARGMRCDRPGTPSPR